MKLLLNTPPQCRDERGLSSLSKVAGYNVPAHLTHFIGDDHIANAFLHKPQRGLDHHHSTVHIERVTGNVSSRVACKEDRAGRNLVSGAEATRRDFL